MSQLFTVSQAQRLAEIACAISDDSPTCDLGKTVRVETAHVLRIRQVLDQAGIEWRNTKKARVKKRKERFLFGSETMKGSAA